MPIIVPDQLHIEGAEELPRGLRPEYNRPGRKIVFVCLGNTCRSPLAATLFNYLARIYGCPDTATSAGTAATEGYPMSRDARRALTERGINSEKNYKYREHKARVLTNKIIEENDLIVAVSSNIYKKLEDRFGNAITPKLDKLPREIEDPFGMSYRVYQACLEMTELAIREKFFA